ncbi:MAG TPA: PH domain-containing protein [Candidatus Paceibacterota bacterium]
MIKLEDGEKIIMVARRHWFVILPKILGFVFGAFIPLLLYVFLFYGSQFQYYFELGVGGIERLLPERVLLWYSLWLLLLWIIFFIEWTDYYLDLWVVTDRRILDVEQKGFFHREVTSFGFRQIQDITVETRGLLETFFKFGTLHIQTAGHDRDIIIKDAANPEAVRSLILDLARKYEFSADKQP